MTWLQPQRKRCYALYTILAVTVNVVHFCYLCFQSLQNIGGEGYDTQRPLSKYWRGCIPSIPRCWRLLNNLEQPFIENDETNAHQNSDIQEQWTSYKWVPMQDSTMCVGSWNPWPHSSKLSDTRWSGKRWCKQCDGIHILLKRSWVDLEIRSSTVICIYDPYIHRI